MLKFSSFPMQPVLFGFSALLLVAGCVLAFLDKPAGASATYVTAFLCLIFSFLAKFKKFEGLGIKAELWEDKMHEAERLVENLRELSVTLAEPIFMTVSRLGRWATLVKRTDSYRLATRIEAQLQANKVPRERIEEAKKDWHWHNVFDMADPIFGQLEATLRKKLDDLHEDIRKIPQPFDKAGEGEQKRLLAIRDQIALEENALKAIRYLPDFKHIPSGLEVAIRDSKILSAEEKDHVSARFSQEFLDLRHYIENLEIRRLDEWLKDQRSE